MIDAALDFVPELGHALLAGISIASASATAPQVGIGNEKASPQSTMTTQAGGDRRERLSRGRRRSLV
jgi:hypothetical protein